MNLVWAVQKGENVTLLHRHFTRTLFLIVIESNHRLTADLVNLRCFLLLQNTIKYVTMLIFNNNNNCTTVTQWPNNITMQYEVIFSTDQNSTLQKYIFILMSHKYTMFTLLKQKNNKNKLDKSDSSLTVNLPCILLLVHAVHQLLTHMHRGLTTELHASSAKPVNRNSCNCKILQTIRLKIQQPSVNRIWDRQIILLLNTITSAHYAITSELLKT